MSYFKIINIKFVHVLKTCSFRNIKTTDIEYRVTGSSGIQIRFPPVRRCSSQWTTHRQATHSHEHENGHFENSPSLQSTCISSQHAYQVSWNADKTSTFWLKHIYKHIWKGKVDWNLQYSIKNKDYQYTTVKMFQMLSHLITSENPLSFALIFLYIIIPDKKFVTYGTHIHIEQYIQDTRG